MGYNATVTYHIKKQERENFLKTLFQARKNKDITTVIPVNDPPRELIDFFKFIKKRTKILNSLEVPNANGLQRLWDHRSHFIKDYKNWKPKTKNPRKQFSSLTRFLLTKYKIPIFMDQAWFYNSPNELQIFLDLCSGKNIRKCENIPIPLTKKQAHYFSQAPDSYSIKGAFRYGQVIGMGGSKRLVDQIVLKLARYSDYWNPLIRVYINNPMLDVHTFGEIVDYINSAEHQNFLFKGRTAESLLRQSEEWHQQIRKTESRGFVSWEKLKEIVPFKKEEGMAYLHLVLEM